ncbi:hypothetical protein HA050_20290 [Iodobacter sp. HSC-16F04]|uniref:Uncharacterized protein n=1 Tax=Iodobacter violaceini TaxID=3044271 RepID=A0ABX0L2C8_9NEIS|nr:hypothetical protein [Iodobacter violacea]NHQ88444.1 hypothetical protein [Iodobacter violacea]
MKYPFITGVATATPKKAEAPIFKTPAQLNKGKTRCISIQQNAIAIAIEAKLLRPKTRGYAWSFPKQEAKA